MTETVLPPNPIAALKPESTSRRSSRGWSTRAAETGGLFEVGGGLFR